MVKKTLDNSIKSILLVDDKADLRIMLKWFLSSLGYAVDSVRNAEEALSVFDPKTHDLVITDNCMPNMTGLEMCLIIKMRSPSTPILMHTANPPENCTCVDRVLPKPAHVMTLADEVAKLLKTGAPSPNTDKRVTPIQNNDRTNNQIQP